MTDNSQKKQICPLCGLPVIFAEIQTCTDENTAQGKRVVQVIVSRCPECKRIIGPGKPVIKKSS